MINQDKNKELSSCCKEEKECCGRCKGLGGTVDVKGNAVFCCQSQVCPCHSPQKECEQHTLSTENKEVPANSTQIKSSLAEEDWEEELFGAESLICCDVCACLNGKKIWCSCHRKQIKSVIAAAEKRGWKRGHFKATQVYLEASKEVTEKIRSSLLQELREKSSKMFKELTSQDSSVLQNIWGHNKAIMDIINLLDSYK